MTSLNLMLVGAIALACFTTSLFFLRFWKTTRDRFFLYFALSFFLQGISRLMMGMVDHTGDEARPLVYLIRLAAFALIFIAFVGKNRVKGRNLP